MKLDIKSIIIIVLLGFCFIFGYRWYFSNNNYKDKLNGLEEKYKNLESEKKRVDSNILTLTIKYDSIDNVDQSLKIEIVKLDIKAKDAEMRANNSKILLNQSKSELINTANKIKELEDHPIKRTGDYLLESIKNKTK